MSVAELATRRPVRPTRVLLLGGFGAAVSLAFLLELGTGAVALSPLEVGRALLSPLGIAEATQSHSAAILLTLRLPRALLAMAVGAALGLCGAIMQGLFRNPLADPGIVGVSSGAALAAIATIVLGGKWAASLPGWAAPLLLPANAFIGAVAVTVIVYRIAHGEGGTSVATLLLAGIGVNALCAAISGMLIYASDDRQLRDITFWTFGSLGGASWTSTPVTALVLLVPLAVAWKLAAGLNGFLLGEPVAGHLGFDVEALKRRAVIAVALGTGTAVAATGLIGFVGLVVPHLIRLVGGSDHRLVLPGAALLGAALLLAADAICRIAMAPAELPIGLVTSAIGAPVFLALLMRRVRAT